MAIPDVVGRIAALPEDWPFAGSLRPRVLERLAAHAGRRAIGHSAETGTGKSTLLLSHLGSHHLVFTADDAGHGDSLEGVRSSPLLRREAVEFVVGPTQRTLPAHCFAEPLDLVLLDGPHAFPVPHLEYCFLYPHLAVGGLLVLDDVHIRAVNDLFRFLRREAMFELVEVVHTSAFFRRTDAPLFDPLGDGWWLQRYNRRLLPLPAGLPLGEALKSLVPLGLRERLRARHRP